MIDTYAKLLEAVADNWLDNPDLQARAEEFVQLAEADIRAQSDWFERMYSVDVNSGDPITVTGQGFELPVDVREVTAIWPETQTRWAAFDLVTVTGWRQLKEMNNGMVGNACKLYISYDLTRARGPKLFFWPVLGGDMDVDFTFIQDLAPLSTAVNGLFLRHPDLYLYGALLHSAPYLQHDERLATWEKLYEKAKARVLTEVNRAKIAGTPKTVILERSF